MLVRTLISSLSAVALLAVVPAKSADINQCSMVADGRANIIAFDTQLPDGRPVTLKGILAGPSGEGPFPAVVMLPGGGSLYTPYCFAFWVKRFASWGYVTVTVASSTAHDAGGNRLYEYSFLDQAMHALGAASFLATMSNVERTRIGVWGFSSGGLTAIELASSAQEGGSAFKAVVAAAPHCPSSAVTPHTPLLVLIGADDGIVAVDACVDYATQIQHANAFEFLMMKDAKHVFWTDGPAAVLSAETMRAFFGKHLQPLQ